MPLCGHSPVEDNEAVNQLPPLVQRALKAMVLDEESLASLVSLLRWVFELDSTLVMMGFGKVASFLSSLDALPLEAGESDEERKRLRELIQKRIFG